MNIRIENKEDLYFYASVEFLFLLSATALWKMSSIQWNIYKNNQRISDVSRSSIKTPEDSFSDKQKCIIKGVVENESAIQFEKQSIFQKKKKNAFVLQIRYIESMYSNKKFEDNLKNYRIDLNQIGKNCDYKIVRGFFLTKGNYRFPISTFSKIDFSSALQITEWQERKRYLSLGEKIQILMLSCWSAIGSLALIDNRETILRGMQIGTRQVEAGITVGSSLMAFGRISFSDDGKVNFEPHALFKDRLSYLTNLKEVVSYLQKHRTIWGVIFIAATIYLIRTCHNYQKKKKNIFQNFMRMMRQAVLRRI